MSDQNAPTTVPDISDRLRAVVGDLQEVILSLPKFRPTDPAQAAEFDKLNGSLLQTLVNVSAAAAVDQAQIDLAAQRKQMMVEILKDRQDTDAKILDINRASLETLLPIMRGAAQ